MNGVERNPKPTTTAVEQQLIPLTVGKTPLNNDRDKLPGEAPSKIAEKLMIDFDKLFESSKDETPAEIVVVSSISGTGDGDQHCRRKKRRKLSEVDDSEDNGGSSGGGGGGGDEDLSTWRNSKIEEAIERNKRNISTFASRLVDKGAKLKAHLQKLEEELRWRKHSSQQDDHGCKKPAHDHVSVNDALEGFTRDVLPPKRSAFATSFMNKLQGETKLKPDEKKLEDNIMQGSEQNIGDQQNSAFTDELNFLSPSDKWKRSLGPLPKRKSKCDTSRKFNSLKKNQVTGFPPLSPFIAI